MSARDILSKKEKTEAKRATGSGTRVSGYIEDPAEKRCGTCEYFEKPNLCDNERVGRDSQVKTDKKTGLKIVNAKIGCCSFWESAEEKD